MPKPTMKHGEPRQDLGRRIARGESREEPFEIFRRARRLSTGLVGRGATEHRGLGKGAVGPEHDEAPVGFERFFVLPGAHRVVGFLQERALFVRDPRRVVVVEVLRFDRSAAAPTARDLEHRPRTRVVHARRVTARTADANHLARWQRRRATRRLGRTRFGGEIVGEHRAPAIALGLQRLEVLVHRAVAGVAASGTRCEREERESEGHRRAHDGREVTREAPPAKKTRA